VVLSAVILGPGASTSIRREYSLWFGVGGRCACVWGFVQPDLVEDATLDLDEANESSLLASQKAEL
jgi:hypothetical protein